MDPRQLEQACDTLVRRMKEAAYRDQQAREKKVPGTNKLQMLNTVHDYLSKASWQEALLDAKVLDALVDWLHPTPDGALPVFPLRTRLYKTLESLPVSSEHLRESGFGRTVATLKGHPGETVENKRKLQRIIETWSSPIFGKTSDFKRLEVGCFSLA